MDPLKNLNFETDSTVALIRKFFEEDSLDDMFNDIAEFKTNTRLS